MRKRKSYWDKFSCMTVLTAMLLLFMCRVSVAAKDEGLEYYKMLSSVEYSGEVQTRNQVETLLAVKKIFLSDDRVQYFISSKDFDLIRGNLDIGQNFPSSEISFIVDRNTKQISSSNTEMAFLERINNHCVKSLNKLTKEQIGKTWKQSFDLSSFGYFFPRKLRLTLTAIPLKTEMFGQMVAVRALSEPFFIKAAKPNGGLGSVKSKIRAVYLFDPEIEEIYLSLSVFEATTKINDFKESLRHEIATYKTNATGNSVDLRGLGKDFEKLVKKIGLSKKGPEVVRTSQLPNWAQTEGLGAAQVANMCAAIACEGASNPSATIFMTVARTIAMQSIGTLTSIGTTGVVSSALASSIPGFAGMKIAALPAMIGGVKAGTAATIAGATAGTVAIVASSDEGARSPSTP